MNVRDYNNKKIANFCGECDKSTSCTTYSQNFFSSRGFCWNASLDDVPVDMMRIGVRFTDSGNIYIRSSKDEIKLEIGRIKQLNIEDSLEV